MRKNLILNYINEYVTENSKGLFIIDAPTGYGKTYQVLKYIRNNYKNKKIFFIANQEKLLTPLQKELVKGLNDIEKKALLNTTLHLKSLLNNFKDTFNTVKDDIDIDLNKFDVNQTIDSLSGVLNTLNTKNNNVTIEVLLNERFYALEKIFRKLVKKFIQDKKDNGNLPAWITTLYPAINIEYYNVIFMTTKKFFLPIDPIIRKSYFLYEKSIDNSVLFIDEIDSTKAELLDIIIDEKSNEKIEMFRLYRNISIAISDASIINDFPVDEEGKIRYAQNYLEDVRKMFKDKNDYLKKISDVSYEDYSPLEYAFKSVDFNNNKNFLFNDGLNITISGKREKNHLNLIYNKEKNRNDVIQNEDNRKSLEIAFNAVLDSINYFISKTAKLVLEYKKHYQSEKELEVSDIYSSIIDRMNLGEENKNYLLSSIHEYMTKGKKIIDHSVSQVDMNFHLKKNDFYFRGFSYLEIVDSLEHHLESKLYTFNYSKTPEFYLIQLAKNYHVVGLSATATINSALVNYDLDYLEHILGDSYKKLTEFQQIEIQKDYNVVKASTYEKTDVDIQTIDDILAEKCSNHLDIYLQLVLGNEPSYNAHKVKASSSTHLGLCANLYLCVDKFMNNEKMHSFIFFSNNNLNNLGDLTELIKDTIFKKYPNELEFVILDAVFYKSNNLDDIMKKSKKVFVATAYSTVGTGVNLQYHTNENQIKKDFDGIFLSYPSNIMPNINTIAKREDLAKYIYAVEYSKVRDSITYSESIQAIKQGFDKFIFGKAFSFKSYDNNIEIGLGIAKVIIQAVGRISRTESPKNQITLFTANKTLQILAKHYDDLILMPKTFEFNKLLEFAREIQGKRDKFDFIVDPLVVTNESHKFIDYFLRPWDWTKKKIKEWNNLRDFVLKYPSSTHSNFIYSKLYFGFSMPTSEYSINNTYKPRNIANNQSTYRTSISSKSSNLSFAMNFDFIKTEFINRGYATEFKKGRYIMSPPLYQRIYKAAIGEKVGQIVLNKYDIKITEIEDCELFELFDFHFKGKVYFDFKNWNPNFKESEYKQVNKIIKKNKKTEGYFIFVINVFFNGYFKTNTYTVSNVNIITIPWLISPNKIINNKAIAIIMEKVNIWK